MSVFLFSGFVPFTVVLAYEVEKAHFSPGTCLEESWRGSVSNASSWLKPVLSFTRRDKQRAFPAVLLLGSLCESAQKSPPIFSRTLKAHCKVRWSVVCMSKSKRVLH